VPQRRKRIKHLPSRDFMPPTLSENTAGFNRKNLPFIELFDDRIKGKFCDAQAQYASVR